jgi:hypothetical protein
MERPSSLKACATAIALAHVVGGRGERYWRIFNQLNEDLRFLLEMQ